MSKDVTQTIIQLARKHGIDPSAAIAVARGEGGLANRPDDVGDLSGGGSYGPFQLYTKGELPKQYHGKPQVADSWAWSPAGIDYALSRMASYGAKGLTGPQAVEAIIRKFERPADPDKSVQLALSRLGTSQVAPAPTAPLPQNPLTEGSFGSLFPDQRTTPQPSVSPRRQFALDTLKSISTGDFSPVSMLRSLTQDFNRAYGGQEIPGSAGLKFPKVRGTVTPEVAPIVQEAYKWLGTPYSWAGGGTKGPSRGVGRGANTVGFDCSGFLQYLMGKKGVAIPRVTYDQWRTGTPVDQQELQPGDAVFFRMGERGPEHVGVYAGNNQFIHAPKTGDVVKVSSLSGYYARNFVGGRRYE